jgi:hypothetical protein
MTETVRRLTFGAVSDFPVTVLLTATVKPEHTPYLAHSDSRNRLAEYRRTLRNWLSVPLPFPLVLCENSGYDLSGFAAICEADNLAHRAVTLLSFDDNEAAHCYGKGNGELALIERCLEYERSRGLERRILKITGRLWARNAAALLAALARETADVACDLQRDLTFADSRAFCATRAFWERYLLPRRGQADDRQGVYFEHVLARAVHSALADGGKWAPLPLSPWIEGTSATLGRPYRSNLARRAAQVFLSRLKRTVIAR